MSKLKIAKDIVKKNFRNARFGIFDTRNTVGDHMDTIYQEDGLKIDICYRYAYFEVFGLTDKEFDELGNYYNSLRYGESKHGQRND